MDRSSALPDGSGAFLRLVLPDEVGNEPEDETRVGEVSLNIRLRVFFNRWFRPIVIEGGGRSEGTLRGYQELLGWWERLTPDPPLRLIDDFQIAEFCKRLRGAKYRRGKLGTDRPLSASRVWLLLRNLRTVLRRIGPQRDDSPTAGLAWKMPPVPGEKPETDLKESFTLEQARAIVAAARRMQRPRIEGVTPGEFWRGLLAWYYVTGLRRGSLLAVEWSMLSDRREYQLLSVPGRLVQKTGKGTKLFIAPWAWRAVAHWPRSQPLIFVWPHDVDHLNDLHYELQSHAGIPDNEQLSIQGWRRTHGNMMGECGLELAQRIAQRALDHGDARTTKASYADFENRIRLKLPPLWDEGPPIDDRQRHLFTL
jgi:integrase